MSEHTALKKALRQMAEGSKSAFHTFYMGTSQYVYSSAFLLYDSHEDACRFMVDFYQYLYLHLPEYDRSVNLNSWISRLLLERYEQLTIGKPMPELSAKRQMGSATAYLSKNEQERVWRMLDVSIRFPKEPPRRSPLGIVLLVTILLFLLLVSSRYLPGVLKRLQPSGSASETENVSGDDGDAANAPEDGGDDDGQEDELDAIRDEIDRLANERAYSGADAGSDLTDELQTQQQSASSSDSGQSDTPQEPQAPQEPEAPQEPQAPQEPEIPDEPQIPDELQMSEGAYDLENLELESYYGDELEF